jgi:radical SAM superfamily enzyme YgiQ (UPF0313 family)
MAKKFRVKLITIPWELEVPTLSLASLAAVTPSDRFDVCIVDLLRERLQLDEPTDLVGITASTPAIDLAYALADEYRRRGVTVVMGGHHVTALPEEALEHADAVVVGEGEGSWQRILDQFAGRSTRVHGIYKDPAPDLASLPLPRIDLLKFDRYQAFYYPVIASRGCPLGCSFCFAKRMTRGYRTYPIRHVLEQIKNRPPWVTGIYFVDDNLAGDLDYTHELFAQLERLDMPPFGMQVRHEFSQDPRNLHLARKAGCGLISSGYESVNQRSLDRTGKEANAVLYEQIVRNIQREGIVASGNWMFGFDWDSPDVFEETWDFLQRSQILHSSFTTEIPFPGTATYRRYEREGRILTTDYREYTGKDRVVVRPKGMTPLELQAGIRWLARKYYSPRHRHALARFASRNPKFLPQFNGWARRPIIGLLNQQQVLLYTYRMVPALRWLYFKALPLHKRRYMGDLVRRSNFWMRDYRPADPTPVDLGESQSPFIEHCGDMPPGRGSLSVYTGT